MGCRISKCRERRMECRARQAAPLHDVRQGTVYLSPVPFRKGMTMEERVPDAVILINAKGVAHSVDASQARELLMKGYRRATGEEILEWYRGQGLKAPSPASEPPLRRKEKVDAA